MTSQMTIDLHEVDRRIAEMEQRVNQTEARLASRKSTRQRIESMESDGPAEMLRIALISEYDSDIGLMEIHITELRTACTQLRAMKFGVLG